ncbi:hypothetical protein F4778DRAFT_783281 [Xylariomycetidae sp. FL2044]|nr:hypothetical protein F4778DRAFT_783281 [Xylariomycetidae sp. FL2044]
MSRILLSMVRAAWSKVDPLFLKISGFDKYEKDSAPKPAPGFGFNFVQFGTIVPEMAAQLKPICLLIIGSGCGGRLREILMSLENSGILYEARGALTSDDGTTFISAGSCWGGGGFVDIS